VETEVKANYLCSFNISPNVYLNVNFVLSKMNLNNSDFPVLSHFGE